MVVDSDETASKLITKLAERKCGSAYLVYCCLWDRPLRYDRLACRQGRVSFLPLNKLTVGEIHYPQGAEFLPMVDALRYDPKYAKAVKQVRMQCQLYEHGCLDAPCCDERPAGCRPALYCIFHRFSGRC